jgi:hypothetical protein
LANFDSGMRRFEYSRPSQPVRLQRVTYEGHSKTRGIAAFPCGFIRGLVIPPCEGSNPSTTIVTAPAVGRGERDRRFQRWPSARRRESRPRGLDRCVCAPGRAARSSAPRPSCDGTEPASANIGIGDRAPSEADRRSTRTCPRIIKVALEPWRGERPTHSSHHSTNALQTREGFMARVAAERGCEEII